MTKAQSIDTEVPALVEIVVEGFIDAQKKAPYLHVSSHSDSYAPIISAEPFFDVTAITVEGFNGVRGYMEPLTTLITAPDRVQTLPNNRWAVDATKPSLAEPERRLENVRLRPRGEGRYRLADYVS